MSTLSPPNPRRPEGYAAEAYEYLVQVFERDMRNVWPNRKCEEMADIFLTDAWMHGFKLVPLDEHDLDIASSAA